MTSESNFFKILVTLFAFSSLLPHTAAAQNPIEDIQSIFSLYEWDFWLMRNGTFRDNFGCVGTNTRFFLITSRNPERVEEFFVDDIQSLRNTGFDPRRPTRVMIHGWILHAFSRTSRLIANAYLQSGDYNVILPDFCFMTYIPYPLTMFGIERVGRQLKEMIEFLQAQGTELSSIYLLGYSLGVHLAGLAGRDLKGGKISVIIGMEAAGPFFGTDSELRLRKDDAEYVLVVHSTLETGIHEPLGHADFYPNYGRATQPGCGQDVTQLCSHDRAVEFFTESLMGDNRFLADQCKSYADILSKNCRRTGVRAYMGGDPLDKNISGVFYFTTNPQPPYGRNGRNF